MNLLNHLNLHWNPSILKKADRKSCWWCGSFDLTGEHKYKRTDIWRVYGKNAFDKGNRPGLFKESSLIKPYLLQGIDSNHLKFQNAICKNCNNSRSSEMDKSYDRVLDYYFENEELEDINFTDIFGSEWIVGKLDFLRYCVKHVACRIFDNNIQPSDNIVKFLNGEADLEDIKFYFMSRKYTLLHPDCNNLFLGPFQIYYKDHLGIGRKMTAISGWYTAKSFSFYYVYEIQISRKHPIRLHDPTFKMEKVDFSKLDNMKFEISWDSMYTDYVKVHEQIEYAPFEKEKKSQDLYEFIKNNSTQY